MQFSRTPSALVILFTSILKGLAKFFPDPQATLILNGVKVLVVDLIARFQRYLALYVAVDTAERSCKTALTARKPIEGPAEQDITLVREALAALFGKYSQDLKEFGFEPAKQRKELTGAEVAAKAQKAKQTRQENRTMGKRQKKLARKNAANGNGGTPNVNPSKPQ